MIRRYQALNLPSIPPPPPVPKIGKVDCPDYPYSERRVRMDHLHISSQREVMVLFKWINEKWDTQFQYFKFLDVELKNVKFPFTLDEFKQLQLEKAEHVAKQLKSNFSQGLNINLFKIYKTELSQNKV